MACGYSVHALAHAALVCKCVTGKPYEEFTIEALFRPVGREHWWFKHYDDGEERGAPSGEGIPDDARYQPGLGGRLIAFVPSLDLAVRGVGQGEEGLSKCWISSEFVYSWAWWMVRGVEDEACIVVL